MAVNRRRLSKQLQQAAVQIAEEKETEGLTESLLVVCQALLRAAEESLPEDGDAAENARIYAGYLGISSRIKDFYQKNGRTRENAALLQKSVEELQEFEKRKKDLADQLKEAEAKAAGEKEELEAEEVRYRNLETEEKSLTRKITEQREKNRQLRDNLLKMKNHSGELDQETEELTGEFEEARSLYEELVAYDRELERIQIGVQAEGFVNFESFTEYLRNMNRRSKELMVEYDGFLHDFSADIEALQQKTEERRKKGEIG